MAAADEDYTHAELARGLERMSDALARIEQKVDDLGNTFVSREVYKAEIAHLKGRVDELSLTVTDMRADYTRRERELEAERKTAWRWGVTTVVAVVALIAAQLAAWLN